LTTEAKEESWIVTTAAVLLLIFLAYLAAIIVPVTSYQIYDVNYYLPYPTEEQLKTSLGIQNSKFVHSYRGSEVEKVYCEDSNILVGLVHIKFSTRHYDRDMVDKQFKEANIVYFHTRKAALDYINANYYDSELRSILEDLKGTVNQPCLN